jgi:COMPASS component SPP1
MKHRALGGNNKAADTNKSSAARRRRKDNHTDNFGNDDSVEDDLPDGEDGDDQAYLRGGILRARELKALTSGVKDLEEFKKLGEGVLSPPRTISPDDRDPTHDTESNGSTKAGGANVVYTTEESSQLQEIHAKKSALKRKREALDDREKLLSLVKARMKTVLEVLKKDGVKDICGFDARLSWSDEEFDNWRASVEGQRALGKGGILGAPTAAETGKSLDGDGDEKMVNGFDHEEEVGKGVCQKKRCERHKAWMKLQLTEINFEREECRMEMVRLDRGEKGVGERAMLRFLESGNDVVDEKQGGAEAVITRVVVADRAEDDLFTVSRNA